MRSFTRLMIRSSLTSAPESMIFLASMPSGVPALTAARSMSPVEICGIAYFWQMKVAWVPLPAPGAPNSMRLMDVLTNSMKIGRHYSSQLGWQVAMPVALKNSMPWPSIA